MSENKIIIKKNIKKPKQYPLLQLDLIESVGTGSANM